ncbi:ketosynthase chain-length factor [Amycolatopsis sp. NPDC089917]|uniref:ketosynthase chain-length factor n=1 Tax=Amycolatopsis sp. NPDC089917 TaxID=3155187 RepID=UPI0034484128
MTAATETARTGGAPRTVRPVVTGLGVVAATGLGVEEYWAATLAGKSGIGPVTRFDTRDYSARLAGQAHIVPERHLPGRLLPQTDHMTRLALITADEVLADAGADPRQLPDYAVGVLTAASGGGFEFGQRELEALWSKGGSYVSAYQSFAWFYPVNTGQISIRHGIRGASGAVVAEGAGGLDAVAKAVRRLRLGTSLMVSGGVDGSLCPWGWICMIASGGLTTAADAAEGYRPFDSHANGHAPGEGGALLTIEDRADALARGVSRSYGEIAGYAATFDPRPGSGRGPALRRAIDLALERARTRPDEVGVVFADASGLPSLDSVEAETIAGVFGPRAVPVTAPKTMTGRLLAGGGALDLATAALSLRDGVVPPTIHIGHPAHPDLLDLVRDEPRATAPQVAVVLARGHGGFNSAMVLRRAD